RLVYGLYTANPNFLDRHLVRFEADLQSSTVEVRAATTHLLATLFAYKTAKPLAAYGHLVAPFLQRFRDVNEDIRVSMCRDFAAPFILYHSNDPTIKSIFGTILYMHDFTW